MSILDESSVNMGTVNRQESHHGRAQGQDSAVEVGVSLTNRCSETAPSGVPVSSRGHGQGMPCRAVERVHAVSVATRQTLHPPSRILRLSSHPESPAAQQTKGENAPAPRHFATPPERGGLGGYPPLHPSKSLMSRPFKRERTIPSRGSLPCLLGGHLSLWRW